MDPFRRRSKHYVARMGIEERDVLMGVFADVATILNESRGENGDCPDDELFADPGLSDDPAVRRLLPEISTDDPDVARDYRRFVHADLRDTKHARLVDLAKLLAEAKPGRRSTVSFELEDRDIASFLGALTDVRLVLAERLEIRTDEDSEALVASLGQTEPSDPKSSMTTVYIVLGWWQETLIEVIPASSPREFGLGSPS